MHRWRRHWWLPAPSGTLTIGYSSRDSALIHSCRNRIFGLRMGIDTTACRRFTVEVMPAIPATPAGLAEGGIVPRRVGALHPPAATTPAGVVAGHPRLHPWRRRPAQLKHRRPTSNRRALPPRQPNANSVTGE